MEQLLPLRANYFTCFLVFCFSGSRGQPGDQLLHRLHPERVEGSGKQAAAPVQVAVRPHPRLRPVRLADRHRNGGQQDRGVLHGRHLPEPREQHKAEHGELPRHPDQPGCAAHQEAAAAWLRQRRHQAVSLKP